MRRRSTRTCATASSTTSSRPSPSWTLTSSRSKPHDHAWSHADAFERFDYPNGIGPGVYDIHSPAVPDADTMVEMLRRACRRLHPDRVWVNPDCGLKTREWPEVETSLRRLVQAAQVLRNGP